MKIKGQNLDSSNLFNKEFTSTYNSLDKFPHKSEQEDQISQLNTAIINKDLKSIESILGNDFNNNVLTVKDSTGYSPIANILKSGDQRILNILDKYLNENASAIRKSIMEDNDFYNVSHSLDLPKFRGITPAEMIQYYLEPLYESDSINKLKNMLGEEVLSDDYYSY